MKKLKNFAQEETGVTLVVVAISMVVLLSFAALCVDMGLIYYQRSKLRTALDAAVLAAVYDLPNTTAATETAKEYVKKNGFDTENLVVTFNEDKTTIRLYDTIKMQTLFANVFNVSSVSNSSASSAKLETRSFLGVFDYRMFSGSTDPAYSLTLGAKYNIEGSVRSNTSINSNPSSGGGYISGNFEAANNVNAYMPNISIGGDVEEGVSVLDMPDFTDAVNQIVPDDWDFVGTPAQLYSYLGVNSWDQTIHVNGNVKIIGNISTSDWVIHGNLYIEGNANMGWAKITLDNGSIYCTGNLNFNNTFSGEGCVFADGDINFNGGMTQVTTGDSSITVYSKNGNIHMQATGSSIHGIVYAPNGGITIAGNSLAFYGSIVAKNISGIPANLSMYDLDAELPYSFSTKVAALIE